MNPRTPMRASVIYPEEPLSPELPVNLPSGTRWGVCFSHDVDHLGLREHWVDGFLIRYSVNLLRQNLLHRFRPGRALDGLVGVGMAAVGHDRWAVIETLIEAERRAGVKSTWFVAVRNGLGITYGLEGAGRILKQLLEAGQEVGLHGQHPSAGTPLAEQFADLARLAGSPGEGMRMHYLKLDPGIFDAAAAAGLSYDSTVLDRKHLDPATHPLPGPRLVRPGLVEIPLHVMDSTLFSTTGLGFSGPQALDYVLKLGTRAAELGRVLVLNLHPNTYSRQSPEIRDWWDGLLAGLTRRSDVFLTDFRGLVPRIQMP